MCRTRLGIRRCRPRVQTQRVRTRRSERRRRGAEHHPIWQRDRVGAAVTNAYPPDQHLLRDLRLSFAHDEVGVASRAWLPVVPEICTDAGFARAGALATLVDVIGGGLAAAAAHPNWIATADLTLHTVAGAASGATVEARGRTLRAGRTTVVLEVGLSDDTGRELGLATMSFSVLPRRDANPDILEVATPGRTTMAAPDSGL